MGEPLILVAALLAAAGLAVLGTVPDGIRASRARRVETARRQYIARNVWHLPHATIVPDPEREGAYTIQACAPGTPGAVAFMLTNEPKPPADPVRTIPLQVTRTITFDHLDPLTLDLLFGRD